MRANKMIEKQNEHRHCVVALRMQIHICQNRDYSPVTMMLYSIVWIMCSGPTVCWVSMVQNEVARAYYARRLDGPSFLRNWFFCDRLQHECMEKGFGRVSRVLTSLSRTNLTNSNQFYSMHRKQSNTFNSSFNWCFTFSRTLRASRTNFSGTIQFNLRRPMVFGSMHQYQSHRRTWN